MRMKHTILNTTRIYCDTCRNTLRVDHQQDRWNKKVLLKESVVTLGNGRHKCKECFNKGIKSKWRFNLNPLKKERA